MWHERQDERVGKKKTSLIYVNITLTFFPLLFSTLNPVLLFQPGDQVTEAQSKMEISALQWPLKPTNHNVKDAGVYCKAGSTNVVPAGTW